MYTLKYSESADRDLGDIFGRIALDSQSIAIKYLREIEQSILRLREFPKLGHKAKYKELAAQGMRILVHDKYLVFYTVNSKKEEIDIIRVLHGSRDYAHLF